MAFVQCYNSGKARRDSVISLQFINELVEPTFFRHDIIACYLIPRRLSFPECLEFFLNMALVEPAVIIVNITHFPRSSNEGPNDDQAKADKAKPRDLKVIEMPHISLPRVSELDQMP